MMPGTKRELNKSLLKRTKLPYDNCQIQAHNKSSMDQRKKKKKEELTCGERSWVLQRTSDFPAVNQSDMPR